MITLLYYNGICLVQEFPPHTCLQLQTIIQTDSDHSYEFSSRSVRTRDARDTLDIESNVPLCSGVSDVRAERE